MDYRLLMDSAVLAGEIMLRNGSETYLVEDTINQILKTEKMKHIEAVVMVTMIIATISNPDRDPITVIRRIERRQTNLNKIYLVQDVVKKYCDGKINLETFFQNLKRIKRYNQYSEKIKDLCTILIAPTFTIMLGGNILDAIASSICGIVLMMIIKLKKIIHYNHFIIYILASILISITSVICSKIIHNNIDLAIIGAIMPMVPGVILINSIRDSINGDYMASLARLEEALIIALGVALGIGVGIYICNITIGGINI
ncbi:MAG: threonine/serine exporter ThrE family protein [Candidatus Scatovivens sp.]